MLTDDEKMRARMHMGYLNVVDAQTFVFGMPAGVQTQFLIEGAMNRLKPEAEPLVRDHLDALDALNCQFLKNASLLAFTSLDEVSTRDDEFGKLVQRYKWFRASLANLLGCQPNPYDMRFVGAHAAKGGACNVPVHH